MLSVANKSTMLSVIMLSVVMLNVVMVNVVELIHDAETFSKTTLSIPVRNATLYGIMMRRSSLRRVLLCKVSFRCYVVAPNS